MKLLRAAAIGIGALAAVAAACIVLGGPGEPAPMKSINDPFKAVDYADLPPLSRYNARDGSSLAFRYYGPAGGTTRGSVVLVHGSSASSRSMHSMAKAFAASGYAAYALDVRGHGDSGAKGDIAYIGQLDDDLEDFMRAIAPASPAALVGFSSGGGFALRIAGGARQDLFANYLLLSPFISQEAPTYRAGGGGWASVGLPRYVAIAVLDRLGIRAFGHLPVVRYALNDEAKKFLTPAYSFNLAQNFRPKADYNGTIRAVSRPVRVIAGRDDELFHTDRFQAVFKAAGKEVPVELLPGIDHIGLSVKPEALQAAVNAVSQPK